MHLGDRFVPGGKGIEMWLAFYANKPHKLAVRSFGTLKSLVDLDSLRRSPPPRLTCTGKCSGGCDPSALAGGISLLCGGRPVARRPSRRMRPQKSFRWRFAAEISDRANRIAICVRRCSSQRATCIFSPAPHDATFLRYKSRFFVAVSTAEVRNTPGERTVLPGRIASSSH